MNYKRKHEDYDWTPLAGIHKHPKTNRAFAAFTPEQGAAIRAFYRQSGAPIRLLAEHFGVSRQTIHRCILNDTKYVRRNLDGRSKAEYWKRKAQRAAVSHTVWESKA